MKASNPLPPNTHTGAVHLRTTDSAKLAEFYGNILGLTRLDNDQNAIVLGVGLGRPLVVLHEDRSATKSVRTAPGLYHLALLLPSRADLGLFLMSLTKFGYPLHGAADHLVSEALYLNDPDGNGIEVYCDRYRSEWTLEKKGGVRMTVDHLDTQSILREAAASQKEWTGMPSETIMGHVHLQVSDLSLSKRFYHHLLGFDITQSDYKGALFLSAGGYHHHLGLNSWQSANSAKTDTNSIGLITWELIVPNANGYDLLLARLASANLLEYENDKAVATDPDGIKMAILPT